MARIIEVIKLKVESTEVINSTTGTNSVLLIGKVLELYEKQKELYRSAGYSISDDNVKAFTFTATREKEDPDETA